MSTLASADVLQINNPTEGTVWNTGVPNFVGWDGNCASMGNDSKIVKVDLVNGPSTAVRYVATLGTLDCSGSNTRAEMTVPSTVPSGQYAIVVRTYPQQSYTNPFRIDNLSQPGTIGSGGPVAAGAGNGTMPGPGGHPQAAGGVPSPSSSGKQSSSSRAREMVTRGLAMLMLAAAASFEFQWL